MYPRSLQKVIDFFKLFPGIGEKSSERNALAILDINDELIKEYAEALKEFKDTIKPCSICGHITDNDICNICNDKSRKNNIICVLEDDKSVFAFEKTGNFNGKYHVLKGLISPIDNIGPDDINIKSLINRCSNIADCEIVIALKSTIEGEATTLYINKILEKYNVEISRLSYGIPMGAEIDYIDSITLDKAFEDRKKIE